MTVFGICMVKNAEDIIGPIVEHMMREVDYVIVADNLSKDNTRSILDSLHGNITVMDDLDPAYRQSEKMTYLSRIAMKSGASHVVPFDADEWWDSPHGRLKDVIVQSDVDINVAPLFNYRPTGVDWDTILNPIQRIRWRDKNKSPLHKIACKTSPFLTIEMGNHNATFTDREPTYDDHSLIQVRHFPYRNADQFVEKAVVGALALGATDLPYDVGQHWRDYAKIAEDHGIDALKDVFRQWFYTADPYKDENLIYDPVLDEHIR